MKRFLPLLALIFAVSASAQSVSRTELRNTNNLIRAQTVARANGVGIATFLGTPAISNAVHTNASALYEALFYMNGTLGWRLHSRAESFSFVAENALQSPLVLNDDMGGVSWVTFAGSGPTTNYPAFYSVGVVGALGGLSASSFLAMPNGAAPTTDAFGEIAADNNAWAASRGAAQFYDGTANTYLVGVLAADTPSNGQVPRWNTGGTITWESPAAGGFPIAGDVWEVGLDGNSMNFSTSHGTVPLTLSTNGDATVGGSLSVSGGVTASTASFTTFTTDLLTVLSNVTEFAASANHQIDGNGTSHWIGTNSMAQHTALSYTNFHNLTNNSFHIFLEGAVAGGSDYNVTNIVGGALESMPTLMRLQGAGTNAPSRIVMTVTNGTTLEMDVYVRRARGTNFLEIVYLWGTR